ncbi:MAG: maleylacetoacetate isomerase [Myxococcales bacterium]|nr:maleylacetoacetate isomerase [Myxococcales bacterium]
MKLFNYWRSSSSYRVRLALAFKQLPYEYVPIALLKGEQHEAAHQARNPWGSVPVLEVEDGGKTLRVPQSVAIVEYLEERFPERPLFPKSPAQRAVMRSMVELVNASIQPYHNLSALNYLKDVLKADSKAWAEHWVSKGLEALEAQAKSTAGRFLLGDTFTFADACLVPQLYGARRFGTVAPEKVPTLIRVEATCLALDFAQKAKPEAQPDAQPA